MVLVIIIISIIVSQIFWIIGMYNSSEKEIVLEIDRVLENAVYKELTERSEVFGGFSSYALYPEKGDTSRYISKELKFADTIVKVKIDRFDPRANLKIAQYGLNLANISPVKVSRIKEFFLQGMEDTKFPVREAQVDYYDLDSDTLIESSGTKYISSITSKMVVMDINNSMGVKVHVHNPLFIILQSMIFQLFGSVILIIIAMTGLYFLRNTFFRQWKEEKMRQDSVSAMTHEFRRQIAAAMSFLELVQLFLEKDNKGKASIYVEQAEKELERLSAYTGHIQNISKNDKSTITLNKSDIMISLFMESLINKYKSEDFLKNLNVNKKGLNIKFDICPECEKISADYVHFANVIDNLIENAIKYSDEIVNVDISVTLENDCIRFSVVDNGIGISAKEIKRLFEKFYRGNHPKAKLKPGFGLGLTYVKSIVELHGGTVGVRSKGIGAGSEFIIDMPNEKN
jgi:Signal transduction histidine kinase